MKGFEKVIGYDSVKRELEMVCDTIRNFDKYKKLGVNTPTGVLLYGEPGVGKTLIANCMVEECNRKVFVCRKDKEEGLFIHKIEKIFKDAEENAPSIILFDDMDKFANDGPFNKNSSEYVAIQSLIDETKDKNIFMLATCNSINCLPDSLLRAGRFDKVIRINNPTGDDAVKIVGHYLSQKKNIGDIDVLAISKILNGKSCAQLEMVVNEAGIYAGFSNKEVIDMDDMVNACVRVIFDAPESVNDTNHKVIESTAYHEAGHAVVAEILQPGSVNIISIRQHTGDTGGITALDLADTYWNDKVLMENRVMSLLGGKAATEIKFGSVDMGSNSDLSRAFRIVDRFVDNHCSYGFDKFVLDKMSSNDLLNRKESQIYFEMEKYYAQAKKIIFDNIVFLDKLAKELMKKQTLIISDIKRIREECRV